LGVFFVVVVVKVVVVRAFGGVVVAKDVVVRAFDGFVVLRGFDVVVKAVVVCVLEDFFIRISRRLFAAGDVSEVLVVDVLDDDEIGDEYGRIEYDRESDRSKSRLCCCC
jgi:hypothetical protein